MLIEKDNSIFFRDHQSINDINYKPRSDRTCDDTREKLSFIYALDPIREQKYTHSSCILNNSDPECIICGTYFISEGQPGQVLKIQVKKCINESSFTKALYTSLFEIKGPMEYPIGRASQFFYCIL